MSQAGIVDIEGSHPQIPTLFVCNVGEAIPIDNTIEILAEAVAAHSVPIETVGSGNTVEIEAQYSSAAASSIANNAGLASFDSASFGVDANGFVTFTGSAGTEGFTVDAFTAPGTNPVEPNSGLITVTGGQVAAGTTANVIRTNSLAANTYTIQIQRSTAAAASTVGDNGVSHFNSAFFTVDSNGFVSLNGAAVGETITGDTGGALSPTAGNWNILGTSTAAGTTPVQTAGSGSTLTVQVQKAQAIATTNATNVGLAAFSSAQFAVDGNGFVTLNGASVGETITGNTGGALSPTAGNWNILGTSTAPGTTPVQTAGSGSTLTVQVQKSQAIASTDATKVGLAVFSSAQFAVDSNGFVTLNGAAVGETITGNTGGALSPTAGNWNILGTSTAAGTTPVQTAGSGSTLTVQVQKAQAIASTNATNVGLAAFDSSRFSVDANGFVTLNGGGVAETITGNTGGALSPTAGNWNILGTSTAAGTTPVQTAGSGSTLTVQVQKSQAIASTDATKVGLAAFDSSSFSVDANGFVTFTGGGGTFYSITPYIVGPDVNSQYSTIQAAINQAIADGASDSAPANIYIKPKSTAYSETLTGAAGIRIIGLSIPTPNQQPIGTNFPRQGVVWTGTCTWASGCMSFQNIQTGYAGSGNIWTIPASGKLILQYCNLINVGAGGVFVATSGNGANLEINSCIPTTVGTLINTTNTGLIVQMQNCAVANGGSINAVDGSWYFDNCKMDAFFIIGNTGAYDLEMNNCKAVDGFQFRADTNTQSGNVIKANYCSFNESGTSIKTNKVSNFQMFNCTGTVGTVVDDSAGSGNTFNFYGCAFNTSNIVSLGSGSVLQLYNTVTGSNPSGTITNSVAVSTSGSDGFLNVPSCAGTPTGTPTLYGAAIPLVVDSTANSPYIYSSGAWHAIGGSGGGFSLSPYICGPTGDTSAQFTGDTAIADAIAQIIIDNPSTATIFIKAGSYASGGFTVPASPFITFIGETLPPGTLQDHSGIGSALQPQVVVTGAVTGTGGAAFQFIQFQSSYTAAQGTQFEWCSFYSGSSFTISDSVRCQFSQCYIGGAVSSISNKYLLASFDKCQIDTSINTVSANGDYYLFTECYFTNSGSIVNTATSGPGMEAYNCRVDSSTWIDESTATNPFSTMKLDNIYFGNQVTYAFRLASSGRGWTDISNIVYNGQYVLIDDTAGTGSNNITISNSVLAGSGSILNLTNNDGIVIKNSVFRASNGISAGNNTTIQLVNCDTFTSQPPSSLGTNSTFTNFVISAPIDSHTTTTGGGVAGVTVGGGAVQNNANCDVVINISVEVTSAAGGQLTLGVGPTNPPTADPVTFPLTVAASTPVTITAYVPYQYYLILDVTGTITTGSITNWVGAS